MPFANPISDMLLRGLDARAEIDLKAAFGDSYTTFAVTGSNGAAVGAEIVDGVLLVDARALGFSDLHVTATGAAGATATDNVRVRVAGENAFTVALLPDTQNYTSQPALNATFGNMTQWLADNSDSKNIKFVIGLGDVTDDNLAHQWAIAAPALHRLDGKIPYSILPGNHDQATGGTAADHTTTFLDSLFSPDAQRATNPDTFGGTYDREPTRAANTYHTFTAPDGTGWLVLSLEFAPRDDVLRWAGEVIEGHLDHRVIIASHTLTTYAGRSDPIAGLIGAAPVTGYGLANSAQDVNDGETVYRLLSSKYPNVTMTVSGHVLGDSAETDQSYSQHGNPIYETLADYQNGSARELVTAGGEGAIRLVIFDPDNGILATETYFTERDAYMTGFRTKEELDRDGLTGPFRGHQETFTGLDLGVPTLRAQAKAGEDLFATAPDGAANAVVMLGGGGSLNPDLAATYEWHDADGRLLATTADGEVALGVGKHRLELTVTAKDGRVTTDDKLVVISGSQTRLLETFNDGMAQGWSAPPTPSLDFDEKLAFGTAAQFGLPPLPGNGVSGVMSFPATAPTTEGFRIRPETGSSAPIRSYTLAMDVLVPTVNAGKWFAFLQTDPAQSAANDADFLINKSGGIGINGDYKGVFKYGEWQRVVLTVNDLGNGNATLSKYLDGVLLGTQTMPTARYQIDPTKGVLIFSDNAPNGTDLQTQSGYVSSILLSAGVLTTAQVVALGKADADGILSAAPAGSSAAVQYDFGGANPFAPTFGGGDLVIVQPESVFEATRFGTVEGLGAAPLPGGSDEIMEFPAAAPDEGYLIRPEGSSGLTDYTIVWDLHAPEARNHWMALLQTDPTNTSDADFLINLAGGVGINGDYRGIFDTTKWQRVALTVKNNGDGNVTLSKFVEGVLVGTQLMPTSRYEIDPKKGFLIFADNAPQVNDYQTVKAQTNGVLFTDTAMSAAEIVALGGAKAGGIVAAAGAPGNAVEFAFDGGSLAPRYGEGTLTLWDKNAVANLDTFSVKGTVFAPGAEAATGQGDLHDRSDAANKVLVWYGEGAEDWKDYSYEVTMTSTDNDKIGVVFYYDDQSNHYRFVMDNEGVTRSLIKVQDGAETMLAQVRAGYRFNDAFDVKIVVKGDQIDVLLDNVSVFDGPVTDANPLDGGRVGVWSSGQKSSIFDDVIVNDLILTAHGAGGMRALAEAGQETATVRLSAASSFGPLEIVSHRWILDGDVVAEGSEAELALAIGTKAVTLEVTDIAGRVASDIIALDIVGDDTILARDSFTGTELSPSWTILDEGTIGGPSDWVVENERLFQNSNIYSEQLTAGGPNNGDIWQRGYSPLGDGTYVLRKGTTALYEPEGEDARRWSDYSVEARFRTPDDDGIGIVFYYQDPQNHYKLELNHQYNVWTLVRLVDGVEEVLGQAWHKYAINQDTKLRIDILDNRISAFVDDEALFPNPIEDRSHAGGTFGLNSWGSQGVSFDDVVVVQLGPIAPVVSGPVALPASPEDASVTISVTQLLGNATDANRDTLAVVDLAASSGTLVAESDGNYRFTPAEDDDTVVTFTYAVSDGTAQVLTTATLDLTAVNDEPAVSGPIALPASPEDAAVTITAAQLLADASDRDGETLAVLDLASSSGSLVASPDGSFRFTPVANDDTAVTFTYAIGDGTAQVAATATLDLLPVGDAPVFTAGAESGTVAEDTALALGSYLAADADGDTVTYGLSGADAGAFTLAPDGILRFSGADFEAASEDGDDIYDVTVEARSGGETAARAVTVSVSNLNDVAPAITSGAAASVAENVAASAVVYQGAATDADGAAFGGTGWALTGTDAGLLTVDGSGAVRLAASANFEAKSSYSFGLVASQGAGPSTTQAVALSVTNVNEAPTNLRIPFPAAVPESQTGAVVGRILVDDVDLGDTVTYTVSDGRFQVATVGGSPVLKLLDTASLSFAAGAFQDVTVTATDAGGLAVSLVVSVQVEADEAGPNAIGQTFAVTENAAAGTLVGTVVATDISGVSGYAFTQGGNGGGAFAIDSAGRVTAVGPVDYEASSAVTLTAVASDSFGNAGAPFSILVNVGDVNEAPVGVADRLAATEDTAVTFTAAQLLGNDRDGDAGQQTLGIASVTSRSGGTAVLNTNGTVTFTPTPNANGAASFDYVLRDAGGLLGAPATVIVDVAAVADLPVGGADTALASVNQRTVISGAALLANDGDGDPELTQALSIAGVSSSFGGTVALNAGSVVFTPFEGLRGNAGFTYSVQDADGFSAAVQVSVQVGAGPGQTETYLNKGVFGGFTYDAFSKAGQVYALYEGLLGRAPDALGFEFWTARFDEGVSPVQLAAGFLASPEGQARAGALDNGAFVTQLYGATLDRAPDAAGLDFWTDALDAGATRAEVATGFALSTEHLGSLKSVFDAGVYVPDEDAAAVARIYYAVLDRAPDAAGLKFWTDALKSGVETSSLLAMPEVQTKTFGLSTAEFVDLLYDNALGREPDTEGFAFWTGAIDSGVASRVDITTGIAQSQEAQRHLAPLIEFDWNLI